PRIATTSVAIVLAIGSASASGATFSYEGRLDDSGQPANGVYDVQLTPFPAETAGASLASPMVFERVPVNDGRFQLEFELPPLQSDQAWVEVGVRDPGTAAFSRIPMRTMAIAAPLIGQCWATTGDTGSNPASNFLGTTDAQPLALRSANQRVTQLEAQALPGPAGGFTASVLQGSPENFIVAGVRGATISGGGASAAATASPFTPARGRTSCPIITARSAAATAISPAMAARQSTTTPSPRSRAVSAIKHKGPEAPSAAALATSH
ncbi:MAG: hypothetical protein IPO66_14055, partial [Rhodanobacteraceae bacterium]|nr:hypothetical protein [Rhodanobacteraceae bacterium]